MKILPALLLIAAIVFLPFALQSGTHHYGVTNNDLDGPNTATFGQLQGNRLTHLHTVLTGGMGIGGPGNIVNYVGETKVVLASVTNGAVCAYLSDSGSNDIAVFKITEPLSISKVGNFTSPGYGNEGISLAASSDVLYSASSGVGTWQIQADCTINLEYFSENPNNEMNGLSVTPDGRTLVGPCLCSLEGGIMSFSVGPFGALTPYGPYDSDYLPTGVDITRDGKYAIFAENNGIQVWVINTDGSLGAEQYFADSAPGESYNVRISPNGAYVYVDSYPGTGGRYLTTMAFTEDPLNATEVGSTLITGPYGGAISMGQMATILPYGNGGGLYLAQDGNINGAVSLFKINPDGTTVEAPNSPFSIISGGGQGLMSLAAWPPRPF